MSKESIHSVDLALIDKAKKDQKTLITFDFDWDRASKEIKLKSLQLVSDWVQKEMEKLKSPKD